MKLEITSTDEIVDVPEVTIFGRKCIKARVWVAEFNGVKLGVLVASIAVPTNAPAEIHEQFEAELLGGRHLEFDAGLNRDIARAIASAQ